MHPSTNRRFRLAGLPADYQRLGIAPGQVAACEDGQRAGTAKGQYEWWYFDAHLDNGATLVVVFFTKPIHSPNGPLAPRVMINLTLADGRNFEKILDVGPDLFNASQTGCDVRIGANRFVGDLNRYHITATIDEISVDIELTGEVPAWRPKSGHMYFGDKGQEKLFAWLPAVPQGRANVRYTIGNEEHSTSGSGYHDHNWGDVAMRALMHNWYWARASAGPYTVIASHITATAAYGHETQIVYLLARDGKILADDEAKVSFEVERAATDGKTGKPVADVTRYIYSDADTRYVVSFERQETILQSVFTTLMPRFKRLVAWLIGFDGAYHRFTGKVTLETFKGEVSMERFEGHAVWELMYFGKARPLGEATSQGAPQRHPQIRQLPDLAGGARATNQVFKSQDAPCGISGMQIDRSRDFF